MKIPVFVALLTGLNAALEHGRPGSRFAEGATPAQTMATHGGSSLLQINSRESFDDGNGPQSAKNQKMGSNNVQSISEPAGRIGETAVPENSEAAAPYYLALGSLKDKFNEIYNFYLPLPAELSSIRRPGSTRPTLSPECERDVTSLYELFQGRGLNPGTDPKLSDNEWAVKLVDSWGKSSDGILKGDFRPVGFIDECLETEAVLAGEEVVQDVTFSGQYCLVTTHPQLPEGFAILNLVLLPLQYGSCIPSSCTEKEFEESLAVEMAAIGYKNASVRCLQKDHSPDFNAWEIAGSVVILLMILPVAVATLLYPYSVKVPPVLKAFSVQGNWRKISDVSSQSARELSAVYGIRVLSIAWIIMGHYYNVIPLLTNNPLMIPAITDEWNFQMVWGSTYAVETFFTLSGLLTTIIIMKTNFLLERHDDFSEAEKGNPDLPSGQKGKFSRASRMWREVRSQGAKKTLTVFFRTYGVYIARRLLWLLPPILLVVMYTAGPSLFFMSGPFRRTYEDTYLAACRQNWWVDLTFVANYLPDHKSCMRISWYIAVDFQMFLVAPLFLLPLKVLTFKYVYLFCLVTVFSITRGIITLSQDLIPINLLDESFDESDAYEKYVRNMPWARAAPFFVGAACALLVLEVDTARQTETTGRLQWLRLLRHKAVAVGGWMVATATGLVVVFGIVNRNYFHFGPTHTYNYTEIFLYSSFTSTAWAVCISWIILATYAGRGNGGPVGSILSHPLWVLPSRFTYSVYVVCYPLELMIYFSIHRLFFVSDLSFILTYSGIAVVCFMVGLFVCLVGEAPYVTVTKLLLPRLKFV